jgi:hypothetical protein
MIDDAPFETEGALSIMALMAVSLVAGGASMSVVDRAGCNKWIRWRWFVGVVVMARDCK